MKIDDGDGYTIQSLRTAKMVTQAYFTNSFKKNQKNP